jgi:hypothetical protein
MIHIKAARRQAFRYGEQLRSLPAGPSRRAIVRAWEAFIGQFDADDDYFRRTLEDEAFIGSVSIATREELTALYPK